MAHDQNSAQAHRRLPNSGWGGLLLLFIVVAFVMASPVFAGELSISAARQIAARCDGASGSVQTFKHYGRDGLCLTGEISKAMQKSALRNAKNANGLIVVVDSAGGSVAAGLTMAERFADIGYDVIVSGVCFSSCANYLFVGADQKVILKDTAVGWHGSTAPRTFERYIQIFFSNEEPLDATSTRKLKTRYKASKRRQEDFVRATGISEDIYFDHGPAYACAVGGASWREYRSPSGKRVRSAQWRPSIATMEGRYNIRNVTAEDPADYRDNGVSVRLEDGERAFIRLADGCLFERP